MDKIIINTNSHSPHAQTRLITFKTRLPHAKKLSENVIFTAYQACLCLNLYLHIMSSTTKNTIAETQPPITSMA